MCDRESGRQRDERGLVRVFAHLRNRHGTQNIQNTFVDAAQGFAETVHLSVASQFPWLVTHEVMSTGPIDGRNHIERADLRWVLGELIAAAGTMLGGYHGMMRQLLQHFGHQRCGNAIFFGDFVGAAGVLLAVHRQVLHSDQTVVAFFESLNIVSSLSQSQSDIRLNRRS